MIQGHTYLYAYIPADIPTHIHAYLQTYIQNPTNPANPTTQTKLPYPVYPTIQNLPYLHLQTTHTHGKKKDMIVFESEASLRGEECIAPLKIATL
jgi:hypothetical protein